MHQEAWTGFIKRRGQTASSGVDRMHQEAWTDASGGVDRMHQEAWTGCIKRRGQYASKQDQKYLFKTHILFGENAK
jgi:hypothetical protein